MQPWIHLFWTVQFILPAPLKAQAPWILLPCPCYPLAWSFPDIQNGRELFALLFLSTSGACWGKSVQGAWSSGEIWLGSQEIDFLAGTSEEAQLQSHWRTFYQRVQNVFWPPSLLPSNVMLASWLPFWPLAQEQRMPYTSLSEVL